MVSFLATKIEKNNPKKNQALLSNVAWQQKGSHKYRTGTWRVNNISALEFI